jgi:hypothetical protein
MGQSFVGGTGEALNVQTATNLSPGLGAHLSGLVTSGDSFYQPAGCVVEGSTSGTDSATYTFNDCTGPFGLVHISGVVDVTWSVTGPGAVTLNFSSSDLEINRATLSSWAATANVTANGDSRTMVWSAHLSGTTGGGRPFVRTNDKTLTWTAGGSCLSISGTSTGTVTGLDLQTTITSYSVCAGACPAAGSEVHVEDLTTSESVDLKFLGGAEAQFTGVNGAVTDLPLACGL